MDKSCTKIALTGFEKCENCGDLQNDVNINCKNLSENFNFFKSNLISTNSIYQI